MVVTLFGVCTSLGLGVFQLNKGMQRLDMGMYRGVATTPEDDRVGFEYDSNTQILIIWAITFVATISVVSGINNGIRRLGEFTFVIGMFLLLSVLFMGDTMCVVLFSLYRADRFSRPHHTIHVPYARAGPPLPPPSHTFLPSTCPPVALRPHLHLAHQVRAQRVH